MQIVKCIHIHTNIHMTTYIYTIYVLITTDTFHNASRFFTKEEKKNKIKKKKK